MNETTVRIFHANASNLDFINTASVDLVVTSPPYFSVTTDKHLSGPRSSHIRYDETMADITAFGCLLQPAFSEMYRVLKEGQILALQTKNVRYGDYLLPLAELHSTLLLNLGFRLVARIEWIIRGINPRHKQRSNGVFRNRDTKTFLVLSKGICTRSTDQSTATLFGEVSNPLWRSAPAAGIRHRFASPPQVVRRLIALYSDTKELILDPFCGHGTIVEEAVKADRRAIGVDIDAECVRISKKRLTC